MSRAATLSWRSRDAIEVWPTFGVKLSVLIVEQPLLEVLMLQKAETLFGIATRNGIILADHIGRLMHERGLEPSAAVRQGSEERLVPS